MHSISEYFTRTNFEQGIHKISVMEKIDHNTKGHIRNLGIFGAKAAIILQQALRSNLFQWYNSLHPRIFLNINDEVCLITFSTYMRYLNAKTTAFFMPIDVHEHDANTKLKTIIANKLRTWWNKAARMNCFEQFDEDKEVSLEIPVDELNGFTFEGATFNSTMRYGTQYDNVSIPCSYKEYKVIFDLLMGKPVENIKSKYGEEFVSTFVKAPINPLTQSMIDVFVNEIKKLRDEMNNEKSANEKEYWKNRDKLTFEFETRQKMCEDKFELKGEELQQKIDSLINTRAI